MQILKIANMNNTKLGSRLKELRRSRGLTQADLAAQIHLSPTCINRYEYDLREPDIETIGKIADFFDVDYNYLLGQTSNSPPQEELDLIQKFRALDDRGKATVLNALEHEYTIARK